MQKTEIPGKEVTGDQVQQTEMSKEEVNKPTEEVNKPERMYTKQEVNDMMTKRIQRSHKAFFDRYGVKDLSELDNLFGQSKSYGPLKEQYDELVKNNNDLTTQHKDLAKKYAFKAGNINPDKISDIETYFKGKELDIDENTLGEELKSHPDWVTQASVVQSLGAEATPSPEYDEKAEASKIFGIQL